MLWRSGTVSNSCDSRTSYLKPAVTVDGLGMGRNKKQAELEVLRASCDIHPGIEIVGVKSALGIKCIQGSVSANGGRKECGWKNKAEDAGEALFLRVLLSAQCFKSVGT